MAKTEHPADETPIKEAFAEVQRRLRLVVASKHGEIPGFLNDAGLCRNCYWGTSTALGLGEVEYVALDIFRGAGMGAWPEFSGDLDFPVWDTGEGLGAEDLYDVRGNKYADDAYGDARRRLAEFLLEWNEENKQALFDDVEARHAW